MTKSDTLAGARPGRQRRAMRRGLVAALGLVGLATITACSQQAPARAAAGAAGAAPNASPASPASPRGAAARTQSKPPGPFPTVGTFFHDGVPGPHHCTATVVGSPVGNTLITAAHCVHGSAAGTLFVPGYRNGSTPYGVWRVTGAYVPSAWQRDIDPHADYAVLTVAPHRVTGRLEQIAEVAGAARLGLAPRPGTGITLVAYLLGAKVPLACHNSTYDVSGWPTIDCNGFSRGSSGSPWLWTSPSGRLFVRGVIGGPKDGGCQADVSNTAVFTSRVAALIARAERGGPPDSVRNGGAVRC